MNKKLQISLLSINWNTVRFDSYLLYTVVTLLIKHAFSSFSCMVSLVAIQFRHLRNAAFKAL